METTPVLKGANLCWAHLGSAKCAKCENLGHISLGCFVGEKTSPGGLARRILSEDDKSRLASIYTRCSAQISYLVFFGGISWANIVGGSFFSPLSVCDNSVSFGSSLEMKLTPLVSVELNDRFAALKHSLASLVEHMDKLAKRLDLLGPMVSQPSSGLMSEGLGVVTGGEAITGVAVFDSSIVSKMEETLRNLSVTVMGLLAKVNNADLVPNEDVVCWHIDSGNMVSIVTETKLRSNVRPWIINKFDGVRIFSSGLDNGFLGARVMIIVNNSLTRHVSKVEEVPGHLFSVQLLFKSRLSVVILGLYVACEINSLIAKAANSSTFMVLGGDFNEDGFRKSASLKFCLNLGLVNSFSGHSLVKAFTWGNFQGVVKIIDYIFVSKSLSSALAGHEVTSVSDFFDTDYNTVLVSIGLDGLLDFRLNSERKQANKDKWKFKIKDDVVLNLADKVFSRHWFSEFDCSRNKLSLKFFKLELLVAKLVKCLSLNQESDAVCLFKVWSNLDSKGASKACTMFDDNESRVSILQHLSRVRKFSDKELMIKSVLDQPFKKVVLDHLILDNELILESKKVKSAIAPVSLPVRWSNQYAPLDHVSNNAFLKVMNMIKLDKFLLVVKRLPDGKAAGMSVEAVPSQWRQAWVSMIPKPYDWKETLTNTRPIALIETARKILSKVLSDRISLACSVSDEAVAGALRYVKSL
ncbi:hypothetical protein G9A89_022218 [Geosiphon pyriformis]|nr:hypothetical protein G9A89_022218 [Geosiphon pyriformis]